MRGRGANPRFGILLKIGSVLGFTIMAVCVKASADAVPITEVCFFRAFFALITIVAFQIWQGDFPDAIYTNNPWGHCWRGLLGLTAMGLNFAALAYLPLPDAIALGYAMPLFLTILAALLLREVVRGFRWIAVFVGLFGVLIILWPRLTFLRSGGAATGETFGAMCALVGAMAVALGSVVVSKLIVAERTSTVVLYFSAICSAGFLLTAPFGWRMPDGWTLALLMLSGFLGGISQLLVTQSYRYADTSAVAPFEYTSMLFGIVLGFVVFGDVPTPTMLLGSSIVIAAGLFMIWREHAHATGTVAPDVWSWSMLGVEGHDHD